MRIAFASVAFVALACACPSAPANDVDGGTDADGGNDGVNDAGSNDAGVVDGGSITPTGLHAEGNTIVDGNGVVVHLHGVNRSGTEYACIQGFGVFDGPNDDASLAAIASWNANAVRVPMNEDCWLAINGAPAEFSGAAYQDEIAAYVARIEAHGLVPILELHWSAPGTTQATDQSPMPDRDHSIDFWKSVADRFADDGGVVLELFNEPFPDDNNDSDAAWSCWLAGGDACAGLGYQAAGMQELVDAVRGEGAANLVLLGGVQFSNALTQWKSHEPNDAAHNLAAAWHIYNFNGNNDVAAWNANAQPVLVDTPIVATEVGDDDCSTFVTDIIAYLELNGQGWLAWTWDNWGTDCGSIALVSDYDGTPTTYGQIVKDHLATLPAP